MIKVGNNYINTSTITRIIDRQVYFSDGRTETYTEPEIQVILNDIFKEQRNEDAKVVRNDTVPSRNSTNKSKRVPT